MKHTAFFVWLFACSTTPSTGPGDAGGDGQGQHQSDDGQAQPQNRDAEPKATDACSGVCGTELLATFGTAKEPLSRAQFGRNKKSPTFHIEAHEGGDPTCPTGASPSPRRTLVIEDMPTNAASATETDGVRAALFDFQGTLSGPFVKATSLRVSEVADKSGALTFRLDAVFPGGTVTGTVFAEHCDSMDAE